MMRREIGVFLIVGTLATLVDFSVYHALIWLTASGVDVAKASSFMTGTVFAYFVNRSWTFGHTQHGAGSAPRFIILYALTMGANVMVNGFLLNKLSGVTAAVHIAFVLATGTSTILNFLGMKLFVFKTAAASK